MLNQKQKQICDKFLKDLDIAVYDSYLFSVAPFRKSSKAVEAYQAVLDDAVFDKHQEIFDNEDVDREIIAIRNILKASDPVKMLNLNQYNDLTTDSVTVLDVITYFKSYITVKVDESAKLRVTLAPKVDVATSASLPTQASMASLQYSSSPLMLDQHEQALVAEQELLNTKYKTEFSDFLSKIRSYLSNSFLCHPTIFILFVNGDKKIQEGWTTQLILNFADHLKAAGLWTSHKESLRPGENQAIFFSETISRASKVMLMLTRSLRYMHDNGSDYVFFQSMGVLFRRQDIEKSLLPVVLSGVNATVPGNDEQLNLPPLFFNRRNYIDNLSETLSSICPDGKELKQIFQSHFWGNPNMSKVMNRGDLNIFQENQKEIEDMKNKTSAAFMREFNFK